MDLYVLQEAEEKQSEEVNAKADVNAETNKINKDDNNIIISME